MEALRKSASERHSGHGPVIGGMVRDYATVARRDGCPAPDDDLAYMLELSPDELEVMFKRLVVGGVPHRTVIADIRAARNAAAA